MVKKDLIIVIITKIGSINTSKQCSKTRLIEQINNAETLNKASRAINRATNQDNQRVQYNNILTNSTLVTIQQHKLHHADDNLKANYDNAIANTSI